MPVGIWVNRTAEEVLLTFWPPAPEERNTSILISSSRSSISLSSVISGMRDSNPGSVTLSPGGVGRNIAHDLRLLGVDVTFVTALGEDGYAAEILKSCAALGFDMSLARHIPGGRTSSYLYITDPSGDMPSVSEWSRPEP